MANALFKVVLLYTVIKFLAYLRKLFKPIIHISFPFYYNNAKGDGLSADISSLSCFIKIFHTSLKICFGVGYLCLPHAPDIFFIGLCKPCLQLSEMALVTFLEALFTILGKLYVVCFVGYLSALPYIVMVRFQLIKSHLIW